MLMIFTIVDKFPIVLSIKKSPFKLVFYKRNVMGGFDTSHVTPTELVFHVI